MHVVYIDADACSVKDEAYRVAGRYGVRVVVVANTVLAVPRNEKIEMVVKKGFGEVDDWIAETAGPGDIVITADIPLAARCLEKGARALGPKGRAWTEADIGEALGMRELMGDLRQAGTVTGGPSAMTPKDRSRFLSKLDEMINAMLRGR